MEMNILTGVKRLSDTAILPTKGTVGAAGWDLYVDLPEEVVIAPGEMMMLTTNIAFQIPEHFFGGIYPRSGLSAKRGIRLSNCVAVIDSDYRGAVRVPLYNDSKVPQTISPHERVAQIIFQECKDVVLKEMDVLEDTDRGEGGFGSTGKF